MRIINCRQGSDEWHALRARPTASEFGKFITAARGDFSKQSEGYAAKIVAKRLGVYAEAPPSFWMDWGTEQEPNAKYLYTQKSGKEIIEAGFIMPDHTDAYGGSPDGLIGDDGMIEIKCPAPETLIGIHADGVMPIQHKPQVQGLLMISGREWCDFLAYHPELTPFKIRVYPDIKYQAKMAVALLLLLQDIERIESKVKRCNHHIVSQVSTEKYRGEMIDD